MSSSFVTQVTCMWTKVGLLSRRMMVAKLIGASRPMFSTFSISQLEDASNIAALLENTLYQARDVRRIHVGTTNFAYRIFLKEPLCHGVHTAILKYSAPLTAIEPRVPFSPDRQAFEAEALACIPWHDFEYARVSQISPQSSAKVRLPRLYLSVPEQHFCIIEDCTPRPQPDAVWDQSTHSFRDFLEGQPESESKYQAARSLGSMLGNFLAQLHSWGLKEENHTAAMQLFSANVPSKDLVTQELFTDFTQNVEQTGYTMTPSHQSQLQAELEKVNLALNTETQSVSMGDFWMGNVLMNLDNDDRIQEIFVIDWEFVNMGPTWLDVGNFIGEAFLIGYFESTDDAYTHVLESFIAAYRDHKIPLDASRALQFAGAHTMMSLSRRIISPRSKATLETANSYVDTALKFVTDPEFRYLQERHDDPLMALVSLLKQHRKAATAVVN